MNEKEEGDDDEEVPTSSSSSLELCLTTYASSVSCEFSELSCATRPPALLLIIVVVLQIGTKDDDKNCLRSVKRLREELVACEITPLLQSATGLFAERQMQRGQRDTFSPFQKKNKQ